MNLKTIFAVFVVAASQAVAAEPITDSNRLEQFVLNAPSKKCAETGTILASFLTTKFFFGHPQNVLTKLYFMVPEFEKNGQKNTTLLLCMKGDSREIISLHSSLGEAEGKIFPSHKTELMLGKMISSVFNLPLQDATERIRQCFMMISAETKSNVSSSNIFDSQGKYFSCQRIVKSETSFEMSVDLDFSFFSKKLRCHAGPIQSMQEVTCK